MAIHRRLLFVAALLAFALVVYGIGKYYATPLILHVVEQSLAQKAPAGTDSTQLRERLQRFLNTAPDQKKKMELLFRISGYLEKVQHLTPEELNALIPVERTVLTPAQ
jgi:hypothetical protein